MFLFPWRLVLYRIEVIGYLVSVKVFYDIGWLTLPKAFIGDKELFSWWLT
jgi:hypothetical protein